MQVIRQIEAARFSRSVLSIGNFDGVHCGHRALLARGRELARAAGGPLVVMTFEPHPAAILSPDRVPPTLTPLPEKLRLLAAAGVDATVIVTSRPEFFHLTAEEFIRDIILERFHPVAIVEGENFRFGRHRQGDSHLLRAVGQQHGFELHAVDPVRAGLGGHPDTVISSSLVRHLLSSGNVDRAAACLGRPYALFGTVRHGAARGRTLGFPTANLAIEPQLVPAEGVYAGTASVDAAAGAREAEGESGGEGEGGRGRDSDGAKEGWSDGGTEQLSMPITAAISIGRAPTFDVQELLIEAFLLDFDGDLYDQPLRLDFHDWIRGQERFANVEALKEQMAKDVARVRAAVGRSGA